MLYVVGSNLQFLFAKAMAHLNLATRRTNKRKQYASLVLLWLEVLNAIDLFFQIICHILKYHKEKYSLNKSYSLIEHTYWRINYVNSLILESDRKCIDHLRMDRHTFFKLCSMLRTIGRLDDSKCVPSEEQVALFLNILALHTKNRIVHDVFKRSGWTISEYFNKVLKGAIRLKSVLLKKPEPIEENSRDERWKWFKN